MSSATAPLPTASPSPAPTEIFDASRPGLAPFIPLGKAPSHRLYRPAKPLTYELRNHSAVYLEDGQYVEAFTFLNSLLVSGTSITTPECLYPAFLAPPAQLALASSLIVYPPITTKAKDVERRNGADAALRYLRSVCSTINPLGANLTTSFAFHVEHSRRRYRSIGCDPEEDEGHERLNGVASNAQSIWQRAEDFWHIVGWAFNCSVTHKKRWYRWKLWLRVMLDFLESDWAERTRLGDGPVDVAAMKGSLIWQYITSQDPQSRSSRRRILRAILAMGNSKSNQEFSEVWSEETAESRPAVDSLGPRKVDIAGDDYGEYDDDEEQISEEISRVPTRHARRTAASKPFGTLDEDASDTDEEDYVISGPTHAIERLGGMEALELRQRLLALIVEVARTLPQQFTRVDDIFDLYTESFRAFPTVLFSVLIPTSRLSAEAQVALNANLLLPLLSSRLPDYTIVSPSQDDLEKFFLPAAAATHSYASNAKVSLILESMFRLMMNAGSLNASASLRQAVEAGIKNRDISYGNARRKKGNEHEEEQAKALLELSGERLVGFLQILELATAEPQRLMQSPSPSSDLLPVTSSLSSAMTMSSDDSD